MPNASASGSCKVGMDGFTNVRENRFPTSITGKNVRKILSEFRHPASNMYPCAYTFNRTIRSLEYMKHSGTHQTHRCYPKNHGTFYLLRGDLDSFELLRREREEDGIGDRLRLGWRRSLWGGEALLLLLLREAPLWSSSLGTPRDLSNSSTSCMASDFPCNGSFFFAFFSLLRSFRARFSSAVSPSCFLDFFLFLPALSSRRCAMMKSRMGSSGSISAAISDSSDSGRALSTN